MVEHFVEKESARESRGVFHDEFVDHLKIRDVDDGFCPEPRRVDAAKYVGLKVECPNIVGVWMFEREFV